MYPILQLGRVGYTLNSKLDKNLLEKPQPETLGLWGFCFGIFMDRVYCRRALWSKAWGQEGST